MESAHRSVVFHVAALALASVGLLSGCDKGSPAEGGAAASSAAASAPAAAGGCDMDAFVQEQQDKGRQQGTKRKFTGCKFVEYSTKSKTIVIAGSKGDMKLSCVNDPQPTGVSPGDTVDVEGTIDGGGYARMYGCVVTKK